MVFAVHFRYLNRPLLMATVTLSLLLIILRDATFYVFSAYSLLLIGLFIIGVRLREVNLCGLTGLALFPIVYENLLFTTGLISLTSETQNRLFQNSLIFGLHLIKELILLVLLIYRMEISKRLFPNRHIYYTFADTLLPWLCLLTAIFSFLALFENYLRNGRGYDITLFFYAFEITGYLFYSSVCGILLVLTLLTYQKRRLIVYDRET
ncbi:hypothetical protein PRUB_a1785 [Pseudoalteromonas rubra]|uniref:Uncharacterized protein n=1 Tax=Pseudoalteromonas rubra TaxID=43658 RepID=A0A8T0CGE9_9GAMM|nr:hypothetical protein [Pseudoalteromonas rubra]KAF7788735.1 hypothetical protein PRUB_a1785 [Pseudoalteromonas rubra]